jgi:uncharacterized DUF497 family protein
MAEELGFDWDRANTEHIASHGVSPNEIAEVFANDEVGIEYDVIGREERWTVVGETDRVRVLIVVYTIREDRVRVITAFEAGGRMRESYFAMKGR